MARSPLHDKRRARNWALLGVLAGLALLFFVTTIVKMATAQP